MSAKRVGNRDSMPLVPLGFIRSRYRRYDEVPHRHGKKGWTDETAEIVLLPKHAGKLEGLDGYSHVIIIFWIHRAREWKMPKDHAKPPHVKLFATRMPRRPNPLGLSVVEVLSFSPKEGVLKVKGLDALDETPVLDIKPYIPHFDSFPDASIPGWVRKHMKRYHEPHGGHGHGAGPSRGGSGE